MAGGRIRGGMTYGTTDAHAAEVKDLPVRPDDLAATLFQRLGIAPDLMLKDEVIEAVQQGKFHVWSVETIDQGIEILTGIPAGEQQPDGSYPEGTINYLVNKRLREFVESMKKYSATGEKEEKK